MFYQLRAPLKHEELLLGLCSQLGAWAVRLSIDLFSSSLVGWMGQCCDLRGFICNESKKLQNLHCVSNSPPSYSASCVSEFIGGVDLEDEDHNIIPHRRK